MAGIQKFSFTNSDLDAQFKKTFTHIRNTQDIILAWYDEENIDRTTTDIFKVDDNFNFTLYTGGPITGTHEVIMVYPDDLEIQGRKLFELDAIETVPNDYRLAVGKAGIASKNILISDFVTTVADEAATTGGLLKVSNNLSEIKNAGVSSQVAARTNLDVYSTDYVDNVELSLNNSIDQVDATLLNLWVERPTSFTFANTAGVTGKLLLSNKYLGVTEPFQAYPAGTFTQIVEINMRFSLQNKDTEYLIGTFGAYTKPKQDMYFNAHAMTPGTYESCTMRYEFATGKLFAICGKPIINWNLHLTYFS